MYHIVVGIVFYQRTTQDFPMTAILPTNQDSLTGFRKIHKKIKGCPSKLYVIFVL